MVKSIKKRYKILLITVSAVILILTGSFLLIRTEVVQTWVAGKVTAKISENINASISVATIHFTFFNKLTLTDLLLLDENSDTLLYASEVVAGIRKLGLKGKPVSLSRVTLHDPVFNIISDSTGLSNLNRFMQQIPKKVKEPDAKKTTILISQIDINGGRFTIKSAGEGTKEYTGGINFSDLGIQTINATIEDFRVEGDTTSLSIYRASFTEKSGFIVDRFTSGLKLSNGAISFNSIEISTPQSFIKAEEFSLLFQEPGAFQNFEEDVRMRLILNPSAIYTADLSAFVPSFKPDFGRINLSGKITGSLAQLRGRDVLIEAGTSTRLECDFDLSGLPDFENTYIFVDVNNMVSRLSELTQLGLVEPGKIPAELEREVGRMTFRGTFSGFTTDFVTYGSLITQAGTLSTDISFRPVGRNLFHYEGSLDGTGINAGSLTGNKEALGLADFELNLDGDIRSLKDFSATLTGVIKQAEINNYLYSNIDLNGKFSEKTWDGSVSVMDENLQLEFMGMIDFQNESPEFDFTLNIPHARLFELNLDKADSNSTVNMLVAANFTGDNIDNITGEIRLLNSTVRRNGNTLDLYDGLLTIREESGVPAIDLSTDFVNASLRGEYDFSALSYSFKTVVAELLPSRFEKIPPPKDQGVNSFNLKILLHDTEKVSRFFDTKFSIAPESEIDISYLVDNRVTVSASSGMITFAGSELRDVTTRVAISGETSEANIKASSFLLAGKTELKGFAIDLSTTPDTLRVITNWDNNDRMATRGAISLSTLFTSSGDEKRAKLAVDSSIFYIRDNRWIVHPGSVTFNKDRISADNLYISSGDDYFNISGLISESSSDTLRVSFEGIDLGVLNNIYDNTSDGKIRLAIGGTLSGSVLMTGVLKDIMVETDDIVVRDFRMIDHEYGNIYINSIWDNYEKLATLTLFNDLNNTRAIDIIGSFSPEDKEVNITAVADRLPIDILNPLLSTFASGIKGYASGRITVNGLISQPEIGGSLFVDQGSMRIDYLQTDYRFSDSIRFTRSGILFNNIAAVDDRGNSLRINGEIRHQFFREFGVDLTINATQAMVLNTKPKDNEMFYGTAFATGVIGIKSSEAGIAFDISARTDRNTRFYVPLSSSQSIGDYSFITFTSSDPQDTESERGVTTSQVQSEGSMSMNIDLEVTPDAEAQLVLDSKAGDVMRGRGNGRLNISLTPKGDFSISGDYIISSGDYLFTLGNILNKRFSVTDGSRISWNGDIAEADIDIRAIYKLEASLYDLMQIEELRNRIPVECHLHMTDQLMNPSIRFDIILPTADEQTRSYLRSAINTDDEMSRQFLYLLVMNRFYPDPAFLSGGSVPSGSAAGTSALGSTTTEMLTNQFSNWISQISNDFDVGFVYRPGNEISPQEVEVALSTQLLNDRVTINGNFDVGGSQSASSATTVTGVFDVEYAINEKLKLKFFNRSNDNILYETAPYTQGLGIFLRYEFDKLKNLFSKPDKPEGKREEEPKIKKND
jgi:hypothetical protein